MTKDENRELFIKYVNIVLEPTGFKYQDVISKSNDELDQLVSNLTGEQMYRVDKISNDPKIQEEFENVDEDLIDKEELSKLGDFLASFEKYYYKLEDKQLLELRYYYVPFELRDILSIEEQIDFIKYYLKFDGSKNIFETKSNDEIIYYLSKTSLSNLIKYLSQEQLDYAFKNGNLSDYDISTYASADIILDKLKNDPNFNLFNRDFINNLLTTLTLDEQVELLNSPLIMAGIANYSIYLDFSKLSIKLLIEMSKNSRLVKIISNSFYRLTKDAKFALLTTYPDLYFTSFEFYNFTIQEQIDLLKNDSFYNYFINYIQNRVVDSSSYYYLSPTFAEFIFEKEIKNIDFFKKYCTYLICYMSSSKSCEILEKGLYSEFISNDDRKRIFNSLAEKDKIYLYKTGNKEFIDLFRNDIYSIKNPDIILELLNDFEYLKSVGKYYLNQMFQKLNYTQIVDYFSREDVVKFFIENNLFNGDFLYGKNKDDIIDFYNRYPQLFDTLINSYLASYLLVLPKEQRLAYLKDENIITRLFLDPYCHLEFYSLLDGFEEDTIIDILNDEVLAKLCENGMSKVLKLLSVDVRNTILNKPIVKQSLSVKELFEVQLEFNNEDDLIQIMKVSTFGLSLNVSDIVRGLAKISINNLKEIILLPHIFNKLSGYELSNQIAKLDNKDIIELLSNKLVLDKIYGVSLCLSKLTPDELSKLILNEDFIVNAYRVKESFISYYTDEEKLKIINSYNPVIADYIKDYFITNLGEDILLEHIGDELFINLITSNSSYDLFKKLSSDSLFKILSNENLFNAYFINKYYFLSDIIDKLSKEDAVRLLDYDYISNNMYVMRPLIGHFDYDMILKIIKEHKNMFEYGLPSNIYANFTEEQLKNFLDNSEFNDIIHYDFGSIVSYLKNTDDKIYYGLKLFHEKIIGKDQLISFISSLKNIDDKEKIFNDSEFYMHLSKEEIVSIVIQLGSSKVDKYLLDNDFTKDLGDYNFESLVKLASYSVLQGFIKNINYLEGLSIYKLSSILNRLEINDLKECLFNDYFFDRLDSNILFGLISKLDVDSLKELLNKDSVINKLNENDLSELILKLDKNDIKKLVIDDKFISKVGPYFYKYLVIYSSNELMSLLEDNKINIYLFNIIDKVAENLNSEDLVICLLKYTDKFSPLSLVNKTNSLDPDIKARVLTNDNFKKVYEVSLISYNGDDDIIINEYFVRYLGDIFTKLESSPEKLEALREMFKLLKNSTSLRTKIFTSEFLNKAFKLDVDFTLIVKFQSKNNKLYSLIGLIENDIENYNEIYRYLYPIIGTTNSLGTTFALDLADSINSYPALYNEIKSRKLNQKELAILSKLLVDRGTYDIKSVDELLKYEEIKDKRINDLISSESVTSYQLKNEILLTLCGITFKEFQTIISQEMSISTLNKIANKNLSAEDMQQVYVLKTFFETLNQTINSTTKIEDLKNMLMLLNTKEKREEYSHIIAYFNQIHEKIRQVYEIDANVTLTNFDTLTDQQKEAITRKVVIGDKEVEYYDLSLYSYAIYAHAATLNNIEGLVKPSYRGHSFICVSPISDKGKKGFYTTGPSTIIFGFTSVPKGGFIASSTCNVGSNGTIGNNSTTTPLDKYYQFEFKDSSSLKEFGRSNHSETNIIRDGFIPSCIIIQGDEPSLLEIEAKERLEKLLNKTIPLVKTQEIGKAIDNPKRLEDIKEVVDIKPDLEKQAAYDSLRGEISELRDSLLPYVSSDQITEIVNVKHSTGASHNIYSCKIGGEPYLLKPGADKTMTSLEPHRVYAVVTGYNIQRLINPDAAIEVRPVQAAIGKNESTILSSAVKKVPNVSDFEYLDNARYPSNGYTPLSQNKVECLLREFIVDHLIFNTDTKGANFIYDDEKIYGIDKEQALKFLTRSDLNDSSLSYTRHTGNGAQTMYGNLFEAYIDGTQEIDSKTFDVLYEICDRLDTLSDEEYLSNFADYVSCISNGDDTKKDSMNAIILSRKKTLKIEIDRFIQDLNTRKELAKGETYGK